MVNFPTSLDTLTNPTSTDKVGVLTHSTQHANINDIAEALEAKVGVDGSAVETSHDYKLGEVTGSDKAVGKSATQTLTNKTLTLPTIASIDNSGTLTLPTGADTLVGRNSTDTLTNKTLTLPTIADFTNATHDHSANDKGGQLSATTAFGSGTIPTARLGSGTANNTTFLRGDQTYGIPTQTFVFGDGSDGDITISSPTTLTRDMYYNNLTVTSTLTTAGFKIHVAGTLSGAGTIDWGTANNGSNGSNTTGGAGGTASSTGRFRNLAGGAGGNGNGTSPNDGAQGTSSTKSGGVTGGVGGAGGSSGIGSTGTGGAGGTCSVATKLGVFAYNTLLGLDTTLLGVTASYEGSGASGGGGAGGGNGGATGGGGGGGASSGGIVYIVASTWAGTFTIKSTGGTGGNGANVTPTSSPQGGGGGGAGGSGGWSVVVYGTKTWSGSYNLAGGTGGTGGTGNGGATGSNGGTGVTGTSYEIDIATLTR